jgi:uncharacterized protein YjbJ (UPF0337 family)
MNSPEIRGDWSIIKTKLKQKWAVLTDADLQYTAGQEAELYGRIEQRTGETHEAVVQAVQDATKAFHRSAGTRFRPSPAIIKAIKEKEAGKSL